MADQSTYSIITVSDDEDDVVIQAGNVADCARTDSSATGRIDAEASPDVALDDGVRHESEGRPASRSAAREAELERLRLAEEDLKAKAPFPAMRAAIFAVAFVLLALAFVWLTFVR